MTARSQRPQLSRDELFQLKWLLGALLTLLGVATVAYMDVDAWWLMALTCGVVVATALWPRLPSRLPRLVHVLAFPFIAAFFVLDLWLHAELLPALVRLDMLLLSYRCLVYRQRRDDLQVIVLGLFLVVVAGVITVSLAFAAQILIYTACALLFLLAITLVESAGAGSAPLGNAAALPANDARAVPGWAAQVHWPRLLRRVLAAADWRVIALSVGLFAGVVAVSAVLFLLIPRFQLENGMFLDRFITKKARTGFSDSIKFGEVTDIMQDTSVALHIDVTEPNEMPAAPYWRMIVLDEYENGTFRMSAALRSRFAREKTAMRVNGTGRWRSSRGVWTFYLESGVSRHLPLLGEFQQLRFGEAQSFQTAAELGLVALSKDPVTMTAYQVDGFDFASRLRDRAEESYRVLPAAMRARRGEKEPNDATVLRELDAQAVGNVPLTAPEFAARVCAWLRERHKYSLSPRIPEGPGDPLVRWANSTEGGHCELFAGAFVLLARSVGFPARVVTGFRGGSWNAFATNSFTVRNADAHAWAEIFDEASGAWLRADPLEPAVAVQGSVEAQAAAARRTDRTWAARLDSLRVFWYRRIVSFDQQTQVTTLKAAKQAAQTSLQRVRKWLEHATGAIKTWWHRPWDVNRIVSVATIAVAAMMLAWLWQQAGPAIRARLLRHSSRREDPVRREAGRWLARLRNRNTPTERPPAVVADLQRIRFGARESWPDAGAVFRTARRAARS